MTAFTLAIGAVPQAVPGGLIQNLSPTASVLLSLTPNPANTDGVILPGASWTSQKECYVRSDGSAACPIVTSQDQTALTSGSTNVTAAVPGSVNITGGSISIANGNVDVAGSVTVAQSITLIENAALIPTGSNVGAFGAVDVSMFQSLKIVVSNTFTSTAPAQAIGAILCTILWSSPIVGTGGSQLLGTDTVVFTPYGGGEWVVGVKGPMATISLSQDSNVPTTMPGSSLPYQAFVYVYGASQKIDNKYVSRMNNNIAYNSGALYNEYWQLDQTFGGTIGGTAVVTASQNAIIAPVVSAGHGVITLLGSNNVVLYVKMLTYNVSALSNYYQFSVYGSAGGTTSNYVAGNAPIFLQIFNYSSTDQGFAFHMTREAISA